MGFPWQSEISSLIDGCMVAAIQIHHDSISFQLGHSSKPTSLDWLLDCFLGILYWLATSLATISTFVNNSVNDWRGTRGPKKTCQIFMLQDPTFSTFLDTGDPQHTFINYRCQEVNTDLNNYCTWEYFIVRLLVLAQLHNHDISCKARSLTINLVLVAKWV